MNRRIPNTAGDPEYPSDTITRIVLTGFMGAGKSTVGALLAERLGWPFTDADRVIEARAGKTIATIFRHEGEPAFRRLEAEVIAELAQQDSLVLALGGGAIETASTRDALRRISGTCIVFLEAPLDVLLARCADQSAKQPDAAVRPVLEDRERLEQRLAQRLPLYREAHLTIPTADMSPSSIVERILHLLGERAEAAMKTSVTV